MVKFIILLTVFLIICEFKYSTCFKWIPKKSGDMLPSKAVKLTSSSSYQPERFVGRTQYLNTLQLAEIHLHRDSYNITQAVIILYAYEIVVLDQFDVLVATERCDWVLFNKKQIPENMVRGGTSWNMEPVYVGRNYYDELSSIFLTSNKMQSSGKNWILNLYTYALLCESNHKWIDATSISIPENSVSNGENDDGYVARLLGPLLYVPGTVFPKSNKTSVWYEGNLLESFNIQVLVDDSQKYSWKTVAKGNFIPEYAVVCGVTHNNELAYISKRHDLFFDKTNVAPISFSQANGMSFEILVENVK